MTAPLPLWLLWWQDVAEGALLCAGGLAAWALALYVATRGGLRRVPLLTAAALALLAAYLIGVGLATLTPDELELGCALVELGGRIHQRCDLPGRQDPAHRVAALCRGARHRRYRSRASGYSAGCRKTEGAVRGRV